MSRLIRLRPLRLVALLVVAAGLPFLGPRYLVDLAILSLIFAIMAMGLNLLMGYTGLDSLGQAAFYGVSAYTVGVLTSSYDVAWPVAAVAAVSAGTILSALIGLIVVRLRGLLFLLATLAFAQLLYSVANRWGSVTGGANGLPGVSAPATMFRQSVPFYFLTLAVFVVLFLAVRLIIRSPFGLTLRSIREQELRSTTLGYNTYWHAYGAFVIAGFLASIAGLLGASYNRFVSLGDLSLSLSFESMLMVILGGSGTLFGPVVGAFGITALRYLLSIYIQDWWLIILGAIYVLATVYLPNGVTGLSAPRLRRFLAHRPATRPEAVQSATPPATSAVAAETTGGTALEVTGLTKRFVDLRVLQGIDVRVEAGQRVGLIGLNGAGKTTLFHLLSGIEQPTSGTISLFGSDVTDEPAHLRARQGMTRTFQITKLYPKLTVRENLLVALMGWKHRHLRFVMWRPVTGAGDLNSEADRFLDMVGLAGVADEETRHLSYGHQRQLEIALALAGEPKLLLLDEPTAGLAHAEIAGMQEVLAGLPAGLTVLIVEHHLEVIFQLVDRVLVLHQGKIIADGPPDLIRNDDMIRDLYFGVAATDEQLGSQKGDL